jgi:hypothetical protein
LPKSLTWQSTGHPWVLQGSLSVREGQALPPLLGCTVTVRERVCVPPPQLFEQAPQLPNPLTWQSTAHPWVLQGSLSVRAGQALPPFFGCTVTVRERVCVPPPQLFEQALQLPNPLTWQSTGTITHVPLLHVEGLTGQSAAEQHCKQVPLPQSRRAGLQRTPQEVPLQDGIPFATSLQASQDVPHELTLLLSLHSSPQR